MHFIFIGRDKPGHAHVRVANREAHLAFLKTHHDKIRIAGPYLDETASEMRGSLLIIEAADKSAVEVLLDADPYKQAGLFADVEILPWRWTIGNPG